MSNTALTSGIRVLIIDDDRSILRILSKILVKKGFTVDTAESGREAIGKLATRNYSAALMDVILQDTNGLDLLNQIRELAPQMAKIVLTGFPSDEDRTKALERGADYYLAKPINAEKLVELIKDKTRRNIAANF